jgi:predicted deacetylase
MAGPARLLLASIHDVSPRFEGEVDRLLDLLAPRVGARLAMLVVPNHWGEAPIVRGSPFARRLRQWAESGVEMFLHGSVHRDDAVHRSAANRLRARAMTAREGEFLGLPVAEAKRRLAEGTALLEDVTGRPITGFVAPAWLYGSGALQALCEAAVPIAEDHWRIWSPASGSMLARGPVVTWASRSRLRLSSSLAAAALLRHAPVEVLRVGVHPPDVHHPRLVRSITRTVGAAAATRELARYSDLLASVRT